MHPKFNWQFLFHPQPAPGLHAWTRGSSDTLLRARHTLWQCQRLCPSSDKKWAEHHGRPGLSHDWEYWGVSCVCVWWLCVAAMVVVVASSCLNAYRYAHAFQDTIGTQNVTLVVNIDKVSLTNKVSFMHKLRCSFNLISESDEYVSPDLDVSLFECCFPPFFFLLLPFLFCHLRCLPISHYLDFIFSSRGSSTHKRLPYQC